jgi:hypothetical protein
MGEGPTAALLQQIFEVDPLAGPTCHGAMRIVACITQASVIDQILRSPEVAHRDRVDPQLLAHPPGERRRHLGVDPDRYRLGGEHGMPETSTRKAQACRDVRKLQIGKFFDDLIAREPGRQ